MADTTHLERSGNGARSPEQIEREIEATREELGETVAAVAAKTDVKGQARRKVEEAKASARDKVEETKASARANPAVPIAVAGAIVAGIVIARIVRD